MSFYNFPANKTYDKQYYLRQLQPLDFSLQDTAVKAATSGASITAANVYSIVDRCFHLLESLGTLQLKPLTKFGQRLCYGHLCAQYLCR